MSKLCIAIHVDIKNDRIKNEKIDSSCVILCEKKIISDVGMSIKFLPLLFPYLCAFTCSICERSCWFIAFL